MKQRISNIIARAYPNLVFIALLGSIGFPVYYYVWKYLLPQPYENLALRLIAVILLQPWLFYKFLPPKIKQHFPVYFLISAFFVLPYFFSFMALKNEFSTVWAMSCVVAILLLVLVAYDWLLTSAMLVCGFLSALIAVLIVDGQVSFRHFQLEFLAIYLVTLIGGIIYNYRDRITSECKIAFTRGLESNVAREMRDPVNAFTNRINSIKTNISGTFKKHLGGKWA